MNAPVERRFQLFPGQQPSPRRTNSKSSGSVEQASGEAVQSPYRIDPKSEGLDSIPAQFSRLYKPFAKRTGEKTCSRSPKSATNTAYPTQTVCTSMGQDGWNISRHSSDSLTGGQHCSNDGGCAHSTCLRLWARHASKVRIVLSGRDRGFS